MARNIASLEDGGIATLDADQLWQERIVSLNEASKLSSLSIDGLRRYHSDKIITLSPKRKGMRVKHALMLGSLKK
jgi:hypothetical protein